MIPEPFGIGTACLSCDWEWRGTVTHVGNPVALGNVVDDAVAHLKLHRLHVHGEEDIVVSWDQVALRHYTDKASCNHGYMDAYEKRLAHRAVSTLLEIGVAGGGSVRMWAELFPGAQIVGVDVHPDCRAHQGSRISIVRADATNPQQMRAVIDLFGPFDVVVDDGSHRLADVMASLDLLWAHVTPGGAYVIEDMHAGPVEEPTVFEDRLAKWVADTDGVWEVEIVPDRYARERGGHGPCLAVIDKPGDAT